MRNIVGKSRKSREKCVVGLQFYCLEPNNNFNSPTAILAMVVGDVRFSSFDSSQRLQVLANSAILKLAQQSCQRVGRFCSKEKHGPKKKKKQEEKLYKVRNLHLNKEKLSQEQRLGVNHFLRRC